jgi:cytochrome c-type protein NapB
MNAIAQPAESRDGAPRAHRRAATVLSAGLVGAALVGFLLGVSDERPAVRPQIPPASEKEREAPSARAYADMDSRAMGPNRNWRNKLADLRYSKPDMFDAVVRTPENKIEALAHRAARRAYDGAPPVVPHAVDAQSAANCLACHRDGLFVGDRLAPPMSHAHYQNCTQCHVAAAPPELFADVETVLNDFIGVDRAGPGERAWPGAPPTIPHTTWMRENCASCHGLVARPGIRTTHPWRANCMQCHAPSETRFEADFLAMDERAAP